MKTFVITDIGSTTTKALLIGHKDGRYRLLGRAEAPTTVEAPYEDVTIGVRNAVEKLSKVSSFNLAHKYKLVNPEYEYYSSSSAGGGLQVLVIGLFSKVTAISAQKAALGAGAILLDVISNDDRRTLYERIEAIKQSRPDMILLTGGLDGGDTDFASEFAEVINSASPKPRFGDTLKLPVIFAGNKDASILIRDTLSDSFDLSIVPNIRPEIDVENLQPAREQIHEMFLSHVMQQAPGYSSVSESVNANIMPTPLAFGYIISQLSDKEKINIISMDIGGATTDIFSVIKGEFNRTVSANLGMSYSIANVLQLAGIKNVKKYLPFEISEDVLEDMIGEKMLSPTSLPENPAQLIVEQAVAREAIRLAVIHHSELIRSLPTKRNSKLKKLASDETRKDWFNTQSLISMENISLIIGSGGVLSHAPNRNQAAIMLIDACKPQGVTRLAVDSVFMMPHLGALAQKHEDIALQVLKDDCFIPLGTVITGKGKIEHGQNAIVIMISNNAEKNSYRVAAGEIKCIPLQNNTQIKVTVKCSKGVSVDTYSSIFSLTVNGGVSGLFIDMRECTNKPELVKYCDVLLEMNAYTEAQLDEARGYINEISRGC